MKKRRFIRHLLAERDKFERLINELGFSRRITTAGVSGQWSVKDIIAHIMSYEQFTADRMVELLHGETYIPARTYQEQEAFLEKFGYPDFGSRLLNTDTSNNWIVEKYKHIPLEEIVAHEMQAFAAIITCLEALSEEQLDRYHLFEQITHNTYTHYREHSRDIEHWLVS